MKAMRSRVDWQIHHLPRHHLQSRLRRPMERRRLHSRRRQRNHHYHRCHPDNLLVTTPMPIEQMVEEDLRQVPPSLGWQLVSLGLELELPRRHSRVLPSQAYPGTKILRFANRNQD